MRFLNRLEEYLLCFMVLQMGCSIFLQVVARFAFNSAITWLDELVHIEVIALTFFGAGLGIRHASHISVDVVKGFVGERVRLLLEVVNHLVIAAYVGLVVYFGTSLIRLTATRPHATPTLQIPKHYLYVMVCIGLALIGIRSILMSWRLLRQAVSAGTSREAA